VQTPDNKRFDMNIRTPVYQLKRQAKALARSAGLSHSAALDQIASEQGFASWSLLAKHYSQDSASQQFFESLQAGELALIAARPGHGKTIFAIQVLAHAIRSGREGWFFTLEWNVADVVSRLHQIGEDVIQLQRRLHFDNSDDISATHIVTQLSDCAPTTVAVIDYLQLLDQKRDKPDLQMQIAELSRFATQKQICLIFISQVDRRFEYTTKLQPDWTDLRLPNPVELSVFQRGCFIHNGTSKIDKP